MKGKKSHETHNSTQQLQLCHNCTIFQKRLNKVFGKKVKFFFQVIYIYISPHITYIKHYCTYNWILQAFSSISFVRREGTKYNLQIRKISAVASDF